VDAERGGCVVRWHLIWKKDARFANQSTSGTFVEHGILRRDAETGSQYQVYVKLCLLKNKKMALVLIKFSGVSLHGSKKQNRKYFQQNNLEKSRKNLGR
jgi:hypothetical protein